MPNGVIHDPYGNYNFLIELDGITRGAFRECSGLNSNIDVIEYREGGENTTVRKLPGMTKYDNITLRWGVTDDTELYDWHRQIVNGQSDRRTGSIVLLGRDGNEVARWNFVRAWPAVYTGPELNAESTEVAIEALELAHEGVERV
jgi:phage tail-like protein